ncbi:MAG: transglutaminase family protein [Pseudomonadota bacterium]
MRYQVVHDTIYDYSTPVVQSRHVIRKSPRDLPHQAIETHSLTITPRPTIIDRHTDPFGNAIAFAEIDTEHRKLVVSAKSRIETRPSLNIDLDKSYAWDGLRKAMGTAKTCEIDVVQYAVASRHTPLTNDVMAYAAPSFPVGRPVLQAAWDLTSRIYHDFKFDPTATDVSTPVHDVLQHRRGVCQDFSHVALACLRMMRVPARYVSGYLLTHPPPGQPRLQGADASHAWISVWAPETGWVEFDPTNNQIPGEEHIAIAYGRDFDDINPISGILLGGNEHTVSVAVDVMPLV